MVHPYNGLPTLGFRLDNERGTSLRDPGLRAYLAIDEVSQEGHRLRRLRPLRLDQAALERLNGELVVAFSCVDATLERPLHAEANWPTERILFGACFADMVSMPDNRGEPRIDWSVFDQIRPCP